MPPKPNPHKIINFIDLGSGPIFERAKKIVTRPHRSKRNVLAIDLEKQAGASPAGMVYLQGDAIQKIREIRETGFRAKVINGDNFFSEHSIGNRNYLQGKPRCNAIIEHPIDPKLLEEIKQILVKNGRLYATTVKWHCLPLAEALKKSGFEVSLRPITEAEAKKSPWTTREYYSMWNRGEFTNFFGREGWTLYRLVAIKRS
ncbi:MAG: hypothetical protein PHH08_00240 [Candidatus ainarchaeum sp.]|nr:hypothetical protein [Candidatus ainarchaeum sp.]